MNITKNGILIDNGKSHLKVAKVNAHNKKRENKRYDVYVEMRHRWDKDMTVVTPFDMEYINLLESEGYEIISDFQINRLGG